MTRTRVVIVVLVLVGILYWMATGLAVWNNRKSGPADPASFEPPAIVAWLAARNPFAAKLDPRRVSPKPKPDGTYDLGQGGTVITVRRDPLAKADDYQTAKLSLVACTPPALCPESAPAGGRAESCCVLVTYIDRCATGQAKPVALKKSTPVNLAVCGKGGEIRLALTSDEGGQARLAQAQVRLE